jgi:hypothetical protein
MATEQDLHTVRGLAVSRRARFVVTDGGIDRIRVYSCHMKETCADAAACRRTGRAVVESADYVALVQSGMPSSSAVRFLAGRARTIVSVEVTS